MGIVPMELFIVYKVPWSMHVVLLYCELLCLYNEYMINRKSANEVIPKDKGKVAHYLIMTKHNRLPWIESFQICKTDLDNKIGNNVFSFLYTCLSNDDVTR